MVTRTFNRRTFLQVTGGVAGLSAAPAFGAAERLEAAAQQPSITALTSMKDRATPITVAERQARIEKAQRLMTEGHIDATLLTGGTSLSYFTGIRWSNSERLFAVIVPVKGNAFCVCPAFENDRAHEQLALGPLAQASVRTWEEDESPFARVAEGLGELGIRSGRLGLEETTKFVFGDSVGSAAPALSITSATPVTAGCRMIKDAHEIALMRLASEVTLKAYDAAFRAMKEGMTQNDFAGLVEAAHQRLGFAGSAGVQVGIYSALPHGSITPQTIKDGSVLLIDGGCSVEGYQSDISRTFVLGKATDEMKKVFDIVFKAQAAAFQAARPGVALESIDAAARKVIVDAGYGPGFKYFTHRLGHGMGMDGHEWPYLVTNNMFGWAKALTAQEGMVFSNEPGIYIRGSFGVRLEDDLRITADAAEMFTPQSRSIEQPF